MLSSLTFEAEKDIEHYTKALKMPPSEMAMLNLESVRFELRVKRRELEGRYKELEQAGLRAIKKIREEIGSRKQPGESSETVTRDWTDEEAILMKDQMLCSTHLRSSDFHSREGWKTRSSKSEKS